MAFIAAFHQLAQQRFRVALGDRLRRGRRRGVIDTLPMRHQPGPGQNLGALRLPAVLTEVQPFEQRPRRHEHRVTRLAVGKGAPGGMTHMRPALDVPFQHD